MINKMLLVCIGLLIVMMYSNYKKSTETKIKGILFTGGIIYALVIIISLKYPILILAFWASCFTGVLLLAESSTHYYKH